MMHGFLIDYLVCMSLANEDGASITCYERWEDIFISFTTYEKVPQSEERFQHPRIAEDIVLLLVCVDVPQLSWIVDCNA